MYPWRPIHHSPPSDGHITWLAYMIWFIWTERKTAAFMHLHDCNSNSAYTAVCQYLLKKATQYNMDEFCFVAKKTGIQPSTVCTCDRQL